MKTIPERGRSDVLSPPRVQCQAVVAVLEELGLFVTSIRCITSLQRRFVSLEPRTSALSQVELCEGRRMSHG